MHYRGEPGRFSFRHALAWKDGVQMELVQPLDGRSIFADHLERHGDGLHHLGIYVPDQPKAVAELKAAGFRALQGARGFGARGCGTFAASISRRRSGSSWAARCATRSGQCSSSGTERRTR